MSFTISINGKSHDVDVDGDTPLLWVLRDVLGMTGTKFGCGMALCGACTVHIDGAATRSCITAIEDVGESQVTTIEAIGATPAGAKIQKACSITKSARLSVVRGGAAGQLLRKASVVLDARCTPHDFINSRRRNILDKIS
jgi:2Fe-2S iron-sulfur cluster binding domain